VYPEELRSHLFFRRRGSKTTDDVPRGPGGEVLPDTFVRGDFDTMRQLVVEYDATVPGQEAVRAALRWKRSSTTADLIVNYQNDNPPGTSFKSGTFAPRASTATARATI
jgi:hypothetical protein